MSGLVQEVQPAYTEGALPNLVEGFEVYGGSPLPWKAPRVDAQSLKQKERIAPGTETYKIICTQSEDVEGFARGVKMKLFDPKYSLPILQELVKQLFSLNDNEMDQAAIRMYYFNRSRDDAVIMWQLIFDGHTYQGTLYSEVRDVREEGAPLPLFECVVACKMVNEYPVAE